MAVLGNNHYSWLTSFEPPISAACAFRGDSQDFPGSQCLKGLLEGIYIGGAAPDGNSLPQIEQIRQGQVVPGFSFYEAGDWSGHEVRVNERYFQEIYMIGDDDQRSAHRNPMQLAVIYPAENARQPAY